MLRFGLRLLRFWVSVVKVWGPGKYTSSFICFLHVVLRSNYNFIISSELKGTLIEAYI